MGLFWREGPLFVKEILAFYERPKPHLDTFSAIVRGLEEKDLLSHSAFGNTYQYYTMVSVEDFERGILKNVINKYFNSSYLSAVPSLINEEELSLDDLKRLIRDMKKSKLSEQ